MPKGVLDQMIYELCAYHYIALAYQYQYNETKGKLKELPGQSKRERDSERTA